jgi:hypothetical protein
MKLSQLKLNPNNPRLIKDDKFKKLVTSLREFPEMMEKRPMVCVTDTDGKLYPLGGNMRLRALQELKYKEIPDNWVMLADEWSEEKRKEFTIKDNVSFGEWDWDTLANEWDEILLDKWGMDVPKETETERLSELKFESIYYEPEEKPNINLSDCIDTEKFDAKIEAIENSNLSDEKKNILKMFAYRFLKIDFENVANYYFFNADEEEQKIMERLRLVLCDSGLNGFIEDDILRAHEEIEGWGDEADD